MTNSKRGLFGFIFSITILIAFFLPWVRPLPEESSDKPVEQNARVLSSTNFFTDYIWMPQRDWRDMFDNMNEGISGYDMTVTTDTQTRRGQLAQVMTHHFLGTNELNWKMRLVVLMPILAIITLFVLVQGEVSGFLYISLGSLFVLAYAFGRWKLAQGDLIHLEVAVGPGLWITLYGALILGISTILHAIPFEIKRIEK